ncbi:MAG: nickel pincer cofactor biosynthesis protein LarB [Mogibacterium sp.]|nr:nickel pincer cofactor biosynthesis protein LarB [Mogibacterium sp.]
MNNEIRHILEAVEAGSMSVDDALIKIKDEPFEDIGYAKVDLHRKIRQGSPEVIYGEGKTAEQIVGIVDMMLEHGQSPILITRFSKDKADKLAEKHDFTYSASARIGIVGEIPEADGIGTIVIATGGTSDIPVAEEAALTAECLGNKVNRLYDVGVAGIHRLLANREHLMKASVVIAVAGMEGALASVVGGLVDCPVIAVPTSVGYGASFHGLSALLSMLNSCASGVAVVNIDNGFGAGYMASRINHMEVR